MIITENQLLEIKGASNNLLSLAEDSSTEEFIRNILYFVGNALDRIYREVEENGEGKENPE